LNTLLSLRLNLEDFDKIPYHFRDYAIASGRVTFKVKGEFEVDLTIADEDFEKQFWFIDFRFAFTPSSQGLSDALKAFLEAHINETLLKDGLEGCYRFLHEFVLTHKINELRRQAIELSRTTWAGTLAVEPLDRALAIQYWTSRSSPSPTSPPIPKSWVMVAVHSGKKASGHDGKKTTSYLVAKWYRDNKEIKETDIPLDTDNLSAEILLKTVIARHTEHILSSIHAKLLPAPRFVKRESAMALNISTTDPVESSLSMQLGPADTLKMMIEPVTGLFALTPHTKFALPGENRFNDASKDPAEEGATFLENIRWFYIHEELNRRGRSLGWSVTKIPLGTDEIKQIVNSREAYQPVCFQRQGWGPNWFVMMSMSLSGDEWWLFEV
jgi:mediator of RNA polymerase II transcription subunit 14